jgi:hypothetical protein
MYCNNQYSLYQDWIYHKSYYIGRTARDYPIYAINGIFISFIICRKFCIIPTICKLQYDHTTESWVDYIE